MAYSDRELLARLIQCAVMQVVGLVVAPVASAVLTLMASKFANKQTLAIVVCAALVIGVAVARYAFYATCAL